ncbi:MAG: hypothetical protein U9N78_02925 [Actinomycetota bacterium]|nr:hypothetical protein [Actinomycetota bacterium]
MADTTRPAIEPLPFPVAASYVVGTVDEGNHVMQAYHTHQRYNSAMPTIQIRDIPEEVHRVYRTRAAEAGQSLQEYLRAHLIQFAAMSTPSEIVAEIRREIALEGPDGFATVSAAEIIRQDRESH